MIFNLENVCKKKKKQTNNCLKTLYVEIFSLPTVRVVTNIMLMNHNNVEKLTVYTECKYIFYFTLKKCRNVYFLLYT